MNSIEVRGQHSVVITCNDLSLQVVRLASNLIIVQYVSFEAEFRKLTGITGITPYQRLFSLKRISKDVRSLFLPLCDDELN